MKFLYYPGCSLKATAKEYDFSTRSVCQALGIELVELKDWSCCGATSAHSTNRLLAFILAARNLAIAQEMGYDLVTPCAACFNRLKRADYLLRNDEKQRKEIEDIVEFKFNGKVQVYSLLEALTNIYGIENIVNKVKKPLTGLKVVCYYGCQLVRPPEITNFDHPENPIIMDKLIAGLGAEVKNWSFKVECCGSNQGIVDRKIAERIITRLLTMAKEAGAEAFVTACPLCQSSLEMRRSPSATMPSFYFTELIGLALDLPEKSKWFKKHLVNPLPLLQSISIA